MNKLFLLAFALLLTACNFSRNDDSEAADAAVIWANAYFNCDFHEAQRFATPESERWLRMAASNVTEHDLQLLHAGEGATVAADEHFSVATDTLRVVTLRVSNYLSASLDTTAQLMPKGTFLVKVVKRGDGWKVRMEGLPRSERRSRG